MSLPSNIKAPDFQHRLLMQVPIAICILNELDYMVAFANEPLLELWDRNASIIGKPLLDVLPEIKGKFYERLLDEVVKSNQPLQLNEVPINIVRKGRPEIIYVNFAFQTFYENDGTPSGIMVVATEITKQVVARKEIEFAEERARLAINSANLGTYEVDLRTNEIHPSARFNSIYGFAHNMTRNDYVSVLHPDDVVVRNKAHEESLTTGNLDYEARVFHKNGSMHWIRVQGKVFYSKEGEAESLLGVVQDITEHKLFTEELARQVKARTKELEEKNSELAEFAKISSHDLQEPLRKITWFTELIKEQDYQNLSESSKAFFDKLMQATHRMSASLKDLLNFSSLGREEKFQTVDLNEVLTQVLGDLEHLIHQTKATIKNVSLPTVRAIPLQMNQLLYNLLNNALKFARPSTPPLVEINTHILSGEEKKKLHKLDSHKEYYEITVKDNGIGFEQNQTKKIFTMFQRLHSKDAYSGTGIGLALCKKVALNHGGIIYATSQPGEGATFRVILPIDYPIP